MSGWVGELVLIYSTEQGFRNRTCGEEKMNEKDCTGRSDTMQSAAYKERKRRLGIKPARGCRLELIPLMKPLRNPLLITQPFAE